MNGSELLAEARGMSRGDVAARFGVGAPNADDLLRPALVRALVLDPREADVELVREVTEQEAAYTHALGGGCGDVQYACCWLLYRIGEMEDVATIWRLKQHDMDTVSTIDGSFLVPRGAQATIDWARRTGHDAIADYVVECEPYGDMEATSGLSVRDWFMEDEELSWSVEQLAMVR